MAKVDLHALVKQLESRPKIGRGPGRRPDLTPEEWAHHKVLEFAIYSMTGPEFPKQLNPRSGPQLFFTRVPMGQDGKGVVLVKRKVGDFKYKIAVEIVNDYYNARDREHDRKFDDNAAGYMQAINYFYELSMKV